MHVIPFVVAVAVALLAAAPAARAGMQVCDHLDFPHDTSEWLAIGSASTSGRQVWFSADMVYVIQFDTMVNCEMTLVHTIPYDSRFKPLNGCITVANVGTVGGLPQIVVVPERDPLTVYQVQLRASSSWDVVASASIHVGSSTRFEKMDAIGRTGVMGVLLLSTEYMVTVLMEPFGVVSVWDMHADVPSIVPVTHVVTGGYFAAESLDFGFAVLGTRGSDREPAQVVMVNINVSLDIEPNTAIVSYDDPTPRALSPTDPNMGLQGTDIVWAQQWKSGHGSIFLWNINSNQYNVVTVPLHSGDEFSNAVVAAKMFIDRIVFFSGTSSHFSAFSMNFQGSLSLASSTYFRGYGRPQVAHNVGLQTGTGNAVVGGPRSGHLYAMLLENLVSMDDTMQLNDDDATVRDDLRDMVVRAREQVSGCVADASRQCPASLFVTSGSCMPACTCGPPTAPVCGPTLACPGGGQQCCEDRSRRLFDCCNYNPY